MSFRDFEFYYNSLYHKKQVNPHYRFTRYDTQEGSNKKLKLA